MLDLRPLTIEVIGQTNGTHPVVLDRVIGGTIYLDEAKRIARRLFDITDASRGFRILSHDHQVIYEWCVGGDEGSFSA